MEFAIIYLVVLTAMAVSGFLAVKKFFLTDSSAGYVFMALNWAILISATIAFVFLTQLAFRMFGG